MQPRCCAGHGHIVFDIDLHASHIDIGQAVGAQRLLEQRRGKDLKTGNACQPVPDLLRSSLLLAQRPVQGQKKIDIGSSQPIGKLVGNEGIDGIGGDRNDGHGMRS
ncbi:hypothetical protein D3C80_1958660 [compost metagenome]